VRDNTNFTIATDIWMRRRDHPFIAFICTYSDANFTGKTVLLRCVHMPGHHTGDSIYDVHHLCITKWKITDRIIRVVSDNASNMLSAFRLPGFTAESEVLYTPAATQSGSESADGASGNLGSEGANLTETRHS